MHRHSDTPAVPPPSGSRRQPAPAPRGRGRPGSRWLAWGGVLGGLLLVVAAAVTPPAVAAAPAAGDWPQFGRTAQHLNTNPAEMAFTPGNVGGLAGGLVLVGSADHLLYAFPAAGCGKPVCQPRAFVQLSTSQSYQGSSIAVSGGKVLLNSTDNTVTPDAPAQTNLYVLALK